MTNQAKEADFIGCKQKQETKENGSEYPNPSNIILQVNYGCYLKCEMCERHTWTENNAPADSVLSNPELTDLFTQLSQKGTKRITLVGTEPVLRPDIKDILYKIRSLGMKPELYTAGIVLDDKLVTVILDSVSDVSFSIDGFKQDSHNRIRYPSGQMDAFGKTLSSIKKLSEARDLRGLTKEDVRITANFTLQSGNINNLETVTQDQIDYFGVDTLRISVVHGSGSFVLDRKAIPLITKFVGEVKKMQTKTNINFSSAVTNLCNGLIEPNDFDKNILIPSSLVRGDSIVGCHINELSATIDPQGNVYPCLYLYDDNGPYQDNSRQEFVMGNIKSQNFSDVWNGEKFKVFRSKKYPDLSEGSRCRTCEYIDSFLEIERRNINNTDLE